MLVEQEKSKYDRMWDYPGYKFWNGPDRVTKFMNKCFTTVQSKDWWIEEMLKHWKTVEDCGSEKSTYALIGRK